ncbi:hypothetical protein NQ318_021330 [Aromia moschata]|uniref:Lipase domain-containing protein n=1 Tax=Aromia moschata TaxID=1265417 RepID=A0AAV8ZDX1_9CUCU|nr:hypothetical protein NQ318_021330 [Aromia moschata]
MESKENDQFYRFNPTTSQIIQIGNDSLLQDSYLNFSNPTVLFFHGFTESLHADDSQLLRRSFLRRGDYNVIVTNADRLLAGLYYLESVKNCRYIGQYGAQLVDYLVTRGLRLATLHVIGMSLGAQIAGFVGQYVTSGRLPRITGLDPAGPLYHKASLDDRLDPSDADFVDVIHTNQAVFGIVPSIGHVDFWPNGGGPKQPGCSFYERFVRSGFSLVELVIYDSFYEKSLNTEKNGRYFEIYCFKPHDVIIC